MPAKYWLGALICLALTDGVAWSVENRAADKPIIGGMVPIPAGEFTMGSDKSEDDTKWRGANALNPYGFNDSCMSMSIRHTRLPCPLS
jgi:formylglycine-generating enzyme required for sulfatase activity